jgi:methylenetetrahydrofolate dehydrogenase (NADP+)/methenyltetrahydrofolate cyclohydrolase
VPTEGCPYGFVNFGALQKFLLGNKDTAGKCLFMQTVKDSDIIHRAELLDGAAIASEIKQEVAREVERLVAQHQVKPCLAAVRVGDDAASAVYVRNKIRACEEVGIRSEHHALSAKTTLIELLDLITSLNQRDDVDGILVQLPLPEEIEETRII